MAEPEPQICKIRKGLCSLLRWMYSSHVAAQIVERRYSWDESILFRDTERDLASTIHWLEAIVFEYNGFALTITKPKIEGFFRKRSDV